MDIYNYDLIESKKENVFAKFVRSVKSWILRPQQSKTFILSEATDFYDSCKEARIWYRGDALELSKFYENYPCDNQSFWKSTMTKGLEIRKIHTNAAEIIVNTGTTLVFNGFNKIVFDNESDQELWSEIAKCNHFRQQLKKAVQETFVVGDGCFRIAYDKNVCEHPMLEFVPGDRVHYVEVMGHTVEIDVITPFNDDFAAGNELRLVEKYTKGLIKREVLDGSNKAKDFSKYFPELEQETYVPNNMMLAIKMSFFDNPKYEGRGKSILYSKYGDLDALDEITSQWMDSVRDARTRVFIPDIYIPTDENGTMIAPNPFDNRYIQYSQDMSENSNNKIQMEQAKIQDAAYQNSYYATFERIISGIWSPSTFGADMKKTDNADAQKEKEKVTLQTRAIIINTLEDVLPQLASCLMECERLYNNGNVIAPMNCHAEFIEYINPTFESVVESVGKAVTYSIMSKKKAIDILYPDASNEEKEKELKAIEKDNENVQQIKKANINTDAEAGQHSNVQM